MIPFTQPFLPVREAFDKFMDGIWDRKWLTNQGPLVSHLENKMAEFLGTPHISFVSSGTMGLQLALKSLNQKGEIITTPFSYVATTSSIVWEGFTPVFADIHPRQLTILADTIEAKITKDTVAIMPTHVFGNPCDIEAIEAIGKKHNIPVIFDAAHGFGGLYKNKPLLSFGDYSVLSTHATKMFHTANGGFVVANTKEAKDKIDRLKNFGHQGQNNFVEAGINGKNSEIHAALGLTLLAEAEDIVNRRKSQWDYYQKAFSKSGFQILEMSDAAGFNGAYFPIICSSVETLVEILKKAKSADIELRRYFYPALNQLSYTPDSPNPIAQQLAEKVFCLPMYHDMTSNDQDLVIACVNSTNTGL